MRDPWEGLEPDGTIRTGASVHRIPSRYDDLIRSVVSAVHARSPGASVYLYGSVTTGQARSPTSDVDVLAVGLGASDAADIDREASARFESLCRRVEIAVASRLDLVGDSVEADGWRVFLHHFCVHLAGPDVDQAASGFPGDRRAACGLNGDIGRHLDRWNQEFERNDPSRLGRRVARKTLLAVAGLVSIHDATWTTDRHDAVRLWGAVHPELRPGLDELLAWATGATEADRSRLRMRLDDVVSTVVQQFADDIGLWR